MIGRFSQLGVYRQLLRRRDTYRVAFAGALALASFLWDRSRAEPSMAGIALALSSVALNGAPIIWGALRGLMERRVNVDELVAIAIIASVASGEFLAAAVVSFVMVLGAVIEEACSDSARKAIEALVEVTPQTAIVLAGGQAREVAAEEVKIGDTLLVKPGARIPADGVITKGVTAVDESSMTGEPIPCEKTVGDPVSAGTLNHNGVIEMLCKRVGSETTLGKVIKLVSEAEKHRPRAIKLIDRYARWFTPAILACAAITLAVTWRVDRAITVLIVGCPCALILAAPTATVAAIGRLARAGILVKGGIFLEQVAQADVLLFDKTGTLTEGKPRVEGIVTADGIDSDEVLAYAASVEQHSTHPLAWAVLRAAHDAKVSIPAAQNMLTEIGLGVRATVNGRLVEVGSTYLGGGEVTGELGRQLETFRAQGATPLVVYRDGQAIGVIGVSDRVRPAAPSTVQRLHEMGVERTGIVSGDHQRSAERVAEEVGVTDTWAELRPQDKLALIREFQSAGKDVIFVGDGINDAPALASANVGVAMGSVGTDVALETADVVLMHDNIAKLPFLIALGRRMRRTIKWNIAFGMVFNAVAVLAGGAGLLDPILGAVVHNIGSVLVVLSSASIAIASDNTAALEPAG